MPQERTSPANDRERVRLVDVDGLRVLISERPGRLEFALDPPLLLCSGIGSALEVLQPFVDVLHPDRGIVRFDVPGVGGSPAPVCPYSLPMMASSVVSLMRRLGHERFDVLGVSWGGALAQQVALQYPSKVRHLVLVATTTGYLMIPAQLSVLTRMFSTHWLRDEAHARRIAGGIYGGSMRRDPSRGAPILHAATQKGSRLGYHYQLLAIAGWSSLPFLPLLRQRTLVLVGDDDPIIPLANAHLMARLIPRAVLHVYPGGHLAIVTESDELAPVVESFLGRLAAGSG